MRVSDEELMRAYVAGDKGAFRELYARCRPRVTSLVGARVRSSEVTRELVQQTFLQLHKARRDFRPDARLQPWLHTIAMNLVRQHFRTLGRRPEAPLEIDVPTSDASPAVELDRARSNAALRDAVRNLPEMQREVIELHHFAGLSYAEIADRLDSTPEAVRARAHRGYGKLRAILPEAEREDG